MTRTTKKQKAPRASEHERKERRRAANRRSAQKSRYKESVLLEELQKSATDLSKSNQQLKEENDFFRRDIVLLQGMLLQSKVKGLPSGITMMNNNNSVVPTKMATTSGTSMDNFLIDAHRTPSPVESFPALALDPDRIFEDQSEQTTADAFSKHSSSLFLTSADTLFRATMASVTET